LISNKKTSPSGKATQKVPFYFYLVLIAIPIFFFILLESGLRIFNYGDNLSMWTPVGPDKLMLNPDVAQRYFSSVKSVPTSIDDIFDKEKKPNSFRVFILGESSAAGYPFMPLGSFSRYIRKRLELTYPENTIEVVNLGLTAISSYTIRDFVPGMIAQKPDLILIYTGHNEYYGALGVGSMESLGSNRAFIKLALYLNKFKTTQLLKNIIQWGAGLISSSNENARTGTLMSRMAKDQYIPFGSDNYYAGLEQFRLNMQDVIGMIKKAKVPLIIGTLACNLKDQKPFISIKGGNYPPASQVYKEALAAYSEGNFSSAEFLFRKARDLDGLRFRATDDFTKIIKEFGSGLNVPVADVDSLFSAESPHGITGDNLMTDHLHPTLHGYQLIGKLFFEKMIKLNYLPANKAAAIREEIQDSLTLSKFQFSKLDSLIAGYRIKFLKNDWPYIDAKDKIDPAILLSPKSYEDSLAFNVVVGKVEWGEAHEVALKKYLNEKNIGKFFEHAEALIYQYPIVQAYYQYIDQLALYFLNKKEYDTAYNIFLKRYEIKPSDLSAKWLGTIDLNRSSIPSAVKYLGESAALNPEDLQTLYNYAGALALSRDFRKSYEVISRVISKDPEYPGAQNLLAQLKSQFK
jgi:tetratricopeptide (TPR) repeat protein